MGNTMIVIDGNSLIHRAFYALPPMKKRDGAPTNAVYGFMTMLFGLVDSYQPQYMAVAFDRREKTFRHQMFEEYKAGRRKTPDELIAQFPILKHTLDILGIARLELAGYEADDILGTLSHQYAGEDMEVYLVTGDRDAFQLVTDHVRVLMTRKGVSDLEVFDEAHMQEVYSLRPSQIVDLKSLMGDSSDNIPGVPGVGEKTAVKLLSQFGTLDSLYSHLDELPKNKLHEKLELNRELAYLSQKLARIDQNIPLNTKLSELAFAGLQDDSLRQALEELEFTSLLKRRSLEREKTAVVEEETLDDIQKLKKKAEEWEAASMVALHYDGEKLSLSLQRDREFIVPITLSLLGGGISPEDVFSCLKPLLESKKAAKIMHDAKAFLHDCAKFDISPQNIAFDTMVAAYVLNPTRRNFSLEKLKEYYGADGSAAAVMAIYEQQRKQIDELQLGRIFYDIEMPLIRVLFDMEQEGFTVNLQTLEELSARYAEDIERITSEIYALAGTSDFNIASTKHLGVILFEKLGLPAIKKTKTGYSTDIEVLEKLHDQHPIIEKIIEYRQLTKLKSTYIDGLMQTIRSADQKVHTTFNQVATATGRISSTEPNLQNIPIRSALSAEIRNVFIPSKPENYIVSADYSQIELRVLAHISGDAHMCDAFLHDEDIHTRTAAEVFDVPPSEVTAEMRSSAKAVNFGIVYGISDFGLARNLGIPRYKAAEYIKKYLEEFDGVRTYMHTIVEQAKQDGYVRTLWGRIRYIDELSSSNYNTRSFGERAALNTPIQGTAADIIKYAMIEVPRRFREKNLQSKLILQVHDELIVDAEPEELEQVKKILVDTMQNACKMKVTLKVNVSEGKTWAEAK